MMNRKERTIGDLYRKGQSTSPTTPTAVEGMEPVAWRYRGPRGGWITVEKKPPFSYDDLQPLYLSPTPDLIAENARLREFVHFVIKRECWGYSLDGGELQEMAEKLGLIREVAYDPTKHGPNEYGAELGDPWFEFTRTLSREPTK